jgi:Zn-dependent protease
LKLRVRLRAVTEIMTHRGFVGIGSIRGIPVRLHLSWLLLLVLATWNLASRYLPLTSPGSSHGTYWAIGALAALYLLVSVLLHEVGHAAAAVRARVPVKSINLLMFGGATRLGQKPRTPRADLGLAVAGPLASLLLVGLFGALAAIVPQASPLRPALLMLAAVNLLLAATNLIPAFPLDGGRALRALYWHLSGSRQVATRWASRSGQVAAFALMGAGFLVTLLGYLVPGLLLAASALYLGHVSGISLKQLHLQELAAGLRVGDVALALCPAVPGDQRLDDLVADRASNRPCYLVTGDGGEQGLILDRALDEVSHHGRDAMHAGEVMTPLASMPLASADEDAWSLLETMVGGELDEILVTKDGRFLGLLTRANLWNHIRRHATD